MISSHFCGLGYWKALPLPLILISILVLMLELVLLLPFPITNQEVGSILGRTVPGSAGSRVRLQLRLTTPGDGSPTNFTAPKGQLPVTLSLSLSGWPATLSDRRLPLKVTFRESSII